MSGSVTSLDEAEARGAQRASARALARMYEACAFAREGHYARARAAADAALALGGEDSLVALVAGIVLFATRDYQRALDQYAVAASKPGPFANRARRHAFALAGRLGWEHEARTILNAAIEAEPEDATWPIQAVRYYVRGRHWTRALGHARRALALAAGHASLWMERASIAVELDLRDEAREALTRALALAPVEERVKYLSEAGRVAIEANAFDLARACFEEALAIEPNGPAHHVRLGELASWAGDLDEARRRAEGALAVDPGHGPAMRLLGGLAVREGRYDEALVLLEAAIAADPTDYQSYVWLSETNLRQQRYTEAHQPLHHATMQSGGFLFVAWLVRYLIVAYDEAIVPIPASRFEEFEDVLREVVPELAETALATRSHEALIAAVEATLAALGANRSIHATRLVDGRLERIRTRTGCRHRSRWALQLLRVADPDECLAEFHRILERYPESSLPVCHRGEMRLWVGDLEGGKADLERAIEKLEGTRWAYMGLSTIPLLEGDYEKVLAINEHGVRVMKNTEGPAIGVFRGEAKLRLGRIDEAIVDLETALRSHPSRASATIALALAYEKAGRVDAMRPLFRRLADEQAPGLISDAAHALGVAIFGDGDFEPDVATMVAVLERALDFMGANRSSGLLTYRPENGTLRFVPHWPHRGRKPHDADVDDLMRAQKWLSRALGRRP